MFSSLSGFLGSLFTTQTCPTWDVVPDRNCWVARGACQSSDISLPHWRTTLPVNNKKKSLVHPGQVILAELLEHQRTKWLHETQGNLWGLVVCLIRDQGKVLWPAGDAVALSQQVACMVFKSLLMVEQEAVLLTHTFKTHYVFPQKYLIFRDLVSLNDAFSSLMDKNASEQV